MVLFQYQRSKVTLITQRHGQFIKIRRPYKTFCLEICISRKRNCMYMRSYHESRNWIPCRPSEITIMYASNDGPKVWAADGKSSLFMTTSFSAGHIYIHSYLSALHINVIPRDKVQGLWAITAPSVALRHLYAASSAKCKKQLILEDGVSPPTGGVPFMSPWYPQRDSEQALE